MPPTPTPHAPIDMALNHGTMCSPRAIEVLRGHTETSALRFYAMADDGELRGAIGAWAGLPASSVLVGNGSGPLLRACIPAIIEQKIRASPSRIIRHLLFRRGYPLIVTRPTYSKVPSGAVKNRIAFEEVVLRPEAGYRLELDALRSVLRRTDGLVYLCTPNNPTGNLLLDRTGLASLLSEFPRSFFFIDEAYADYVPPERRPQFADLVPAHENLLLLRSFSFAHGLAAVHVGCALTHPGLVARLQARVTPHVVGRLNADLVIASLGDPTHLAHVREGMAMERTRVTEALRRMPGVEAFDSETNFIYARFTDGQSAAPFAARLEALGVVIKTFEPIGDTRDDTSFRITVGLPAENARLLELIETHFGAALAHSGAA